MKPIHTEHVVVVEARWGVKAGADGLVDEVSESLYAM